MKNGQENYSNNKKTKWIVCILLIIVFLIPYSIVNHLEISRYTIAFMFGEESIPFLPWTFPIYLSAFVQGAVIIRFIPRNFLGKVFLILACIVIIGLTTFILLPIEYPRNLYPSTNNLITLFRIADGTGNCFPSLHVALSVVLTACFSLFEKSRIRRLLMWIWTTVIIISVLTTKQHYLIDVLGGIILAIPFVLVLRKQFFNRALQNDFKNYKL